MRFFATPPHPCSYLPGRDATTVFLDPEVTPDRRLYGALVARGFRRSGEHLYRPHCGACQACVPLRVVVDAFVPRRRHRRVSARNADLRLAVIDGHFDDEHYALYARYIAQRHGDGDMFPTTPAQYRSFLLSPWSPTRFIDFRCGDTLVACAVIDLLDDGISAVYTFYDPDHGERSPGVFAILAEIELARSLGLRHVYLGYWIEESDRMRYKRDYRPAEVLQDDHWRPLR